MRFGYSIIYVADVAETVRFYEQAFGLAPRFVHDSGGYAEMETGPTSLAFTAEALAAQTCPDFALNRLHATPAGSEVAFVTDDVQAAFDHAVAAGAVSVATPRIKPWGQTISYVRDINGYLVEICSPVGS